ncbi:2-nitropropane dioxygenase [endosymbiont 'TC1' of Trimyema compressum]|uniref:enoyl-[acyl-carrier-protein] reductase FabK n=1 Tax=endosymbiont 'TC1' of Trimyema compressum TaxID=243899 RepID=UPI0007F183F0|nr:enoyl-[acyl-carrier-protein] reductase FabK [endosymbiont 'TC1' of Trimyema compressum]AMP21279.1 2-nitropropane dioxygenase [endosymbiont 'TC1' of Trimyema compressum]
MFNKKLTKILNIEYPIIQGGMTWIAESNLAAAVSNAGGLGIIAAGGAPGDWLREQIQKTRTLTNKPFGVNIMLLSPFAEEVAQVVVEEKVPVVITGAGSPEKYMAMWKARNITVIPVVPSVLLGSRMEKLGADAVVAEGMEAGGHIGELTTMALMPQVVDALNIPVIAAGGIGDGRGVAAVAMLGAAGVQVGTRFLAADECIVSDAYKEKVIKARDTDTMITGRSTGHPVRGLKNKFARNFVKLEKDETMTLEDIEKLGAGSLRAAVEGDVVNGALMAGQVAGMVRKTEPAKDIVESLYNEAKEIIKKISETL